MHTYLVEARDSDGELTARLDAGHGDDVASLIRVLTSRDDPPAEITLRLQREV